MTKDELEIAYTQLKADLATAKQGLEHYANCDNWGDESGHNDIFSVRPDENGFDLAQQTLDKISKE